MKRLFIRVITVIIIFGCMGILVKNSYNHETHEATEFNNSYVGFKPCLTKDAVEVMVYVHSYDEYISYRKAISNTFYKDITTLKLSNNY